MGIALYRKYRPQKLADLLGQDANIAILQNAARTERLGHAYLFYGPRGSGKTTMARLLAKLLNCETRRTDAAFREMGEPCNACEACREIEMGNAFDVIEIDAASNRGIDEIRNLKESIVVAPTKARYKVYIIDEAHMLTPPAFNALLKTLEEPPRHAILILATTEYEKLPPTITSRTQRFAFKKLSKLVIIKKLVKIAAEEHIATSEDALELIAAIAEGSLRDAESLLDQLGSLGKPITLQAVEELTGRVGFRKVISLAKLIAANDLKGSLAYLTELQEEGHNFVQFTRDLIHYMRKVLMLSLNPTAASLLATDITEDELVQIKTLAANADTHFLATLIKTLIRAYSEMRYSPFAMIPLEVALVEHLKERSI